MGNLNWTEHSVAVKFGDGYAVWFSPSQSFVLLKGAAYEVFRLLAEGKETEFVVTTLKKQTGQPEGEVREFLTELKAGFDRLMDSSNLPYVPPIPPPDISTSSFETFKSCHYKINGKNFHFDYGSEDLFQQFHPLLAHLSDQNGGKVDFNLELFSKDLFLFFRLNGRMVEHFRSEHIHYLKGAVLKKIAGLMYSIPDENWMASLHASAITDGKSAILFSAKPGGGKSTIAALLQNRGFTILSDDFITLDNREKKVWQQPLAISVKDGSYDSLVKFYPQLKRNSSQISAAGKSVHYLAPLENGKKLPSSFPVIAVIFIQYSADVQFQIEKVNAEEALMNLLAETWVNPQKENVKQFLNWAEGLNYFRIKYSDYSKVNEEITRIFTL